MNEFQLTKSQRSHFFINLYVLLLIKTPFTCGRLMIKIKLPRKNRLLEGSTDPLLVSWSPTNVQVLYALLKVVVYIFHVVFSTFSLNEIAPVVFILTAAKMCILLSHRRVRELFAWYQHFCRNGSLFMFITSK